jgi:hypothetical protein
VSAGTAAVGVRAIATGLAGVAVALALTACTAKDSGYVEIKTVPVANNATLYLNSVRLDPLKNGSAVLRQNVGTAKLAADGPGGKIALSDLVVRKNRITTVTVSVLERPPRCQCRGSGGGTEAAGGRSCVG